MPHPNHWKSEPFDERRLEYMTCPKCGHGGKPRVEYGDARVERVYSACDLYYPERIALFCSQCGHEEWMRPKDYVYRAYVPPEPWLRPLIDRLRKKILDNTVFGRT
jgi:hypothetical protein